VPNKVDKLGQDADSTTYQRHSECILVNLEPLSFTVSVTVSERQAERTDAEFVQLLFELSMKV
jgi:hypothetical protein